MNYIDAAHGLTFCLRVAGSAKPSLGIDLIHDARYLELVVSGQDQSPKLLGFLAFGDLAEGYVYYGCVYLIY